MPGSGGSDSFSFLVSLVNNIALLIALTQVHGLLMRYLSRAGSSDWLTRIVLPGLLYGCVVVVGMAAPVVFRTGLIFDERSVVLSLASAFAGPWAGGIAAITAMIYRWLIGGPGMYMGIAVILESWLLGTIFYRRFPVPTGDKNFYIHLGVLQWAVHGCMLVMTVLLPADVRWSTVERIVLPTLTIYPMGGVLLGLLLAELRLRAVAEAALQASEKRYRELVDSVPGIIDRWDPDGRLLFMNDFGLRFFGFKAEEILGRPFTETLLPEVDERGRRLSNLPAEICAHPETYRINEHTCQKKNGEKVWIRWSNMPIRDGEGKIVEFLSVGMDLTDQRKLEMERRSLEQQLMQAQKMEAVGVLAGGLAHDLNNMMVPVVGYAEILLMNDALDEESRHALEEILHSAERARKLIQQLMAFSRRKSLDTQEVEMNELLSSMMAMLRRLVRENIELVFLPSPIPVRVMADAGQLEQVIMNLVVNAVDAMPEGGVLTIHLSRLDMGEEQARRMGLSQPGRYGCLVVQDTGVGIAEEHLSRIFDPFFTTKKPGQGTGLGLAMSYSIVRQHGGLITVDSEPGKGTTFRILLPEVHTEGIAEEPPIDFAEASKQTTAGMLGKDAAGQAMTVVVAEDETAVRQMLVTLLTHMGFAVYTAETPEACLNLALSRDKVDLLVTDVLMPRMNGLQLNDAIRNRHPYMKTLFISGHTEDMIHPEMLSASGAAFLQKPFRRKQLEWAIARLMVASK